MMLRDFDADFPGLRAGAARSEGDLYSLYARLRSTAPFWRSPWGDVYLSSWALVDEALSRREFSHTLRTQNGSEQNGRGSPISDWLIFKDGANHAALRRAFLPPFGKDDGALLRRVTAIVDEHLSTIERDRPIDAVAAFTRAIPEKIVCAMMDIPLGDMAQLRAWSQDIRTVLDTGMDGLAYGREGPAHDFTDYFEAMLKRLPAASKRVGLFDVTKLADRAGFRETAANLMFIAFSGHETTVHLLANMVLHLAQNPELWDCVRSEPERAGNLVSEVLRLESPVLKLCRWAASDVEFSDGHSLHAGENTVLLLGAANRDPLRFPAPDRVDLRRAPAAHLAFGKGAHSCIGRSLATIEGEVVLRWLIRNVQRLELHEDGFSWIANSTFRGLSRLLLTLRA